MTAQPNRLDFVQEAPNNPEAENGLVNLLISNGDLLFRAEEAGVTDGFFFNSQAGFIYGLLRQLTDEGQGAHPTRFVLVQRLKTLGAEGREYLTYYTKVFSEIVPEEWFDRYLKQVIDCYRKRQLASMALRLSQLAYDEKLSSDIGLTFVQEEAERIENLTHPINIINGTQLEQDMRSFYELAPNKPHGTPYFNTALDSVTAGTHLGELTIVRAEPGSGKSALLQQFCYLRAARLKRPQLYLTINDMTARQMYNRVIQQITGVSSVALDHGKFQDNSGFDHWKKIDAKLSELPTMPLYICEDSDLTSHNLRRIIKSLLRKVPTLDVYVDYLQQFDDRGEIYERTAAISNNLLYCAHKIKDPSTGDPRVSITAISSMNKSGEMFGAKKLEHDAENVWLLENPKAKDRALPLDKKSGKATIVIEKQRHRITGIEVPVYWNAPFARFEEYQGQDESR